MFFVKVVIMFIGFIAILALSDFIKKKDTAVFVCMILTALLVAIFHI